MGKLIVFAVILLGTMGSWSITSSTVSVSSRAGVSWEAWLPAIVMAESGGYQWAVSRKGARYGRGYLQISEVALQHYIWETPGTEWMSDPKCLFNTNIGRTIALWYLYKASRVYDEIDYPASRFAFCLSAYNIGIDGTISNGINYPYVERVFSYRRYVTQ